MRKRRWALFAFIFLIASLFVVLESWKIVKANEKLRTLILAELRPVLGSQLYIRQVHVSFGNIHLQNVRMPVPGRSVVIYIKDLRLGYSFLNLLVRGFDIQHISHDALFIEPHIIFYRTSADSNRSPSVSLPVAEQTDERKDDGTRLVRLFHYVSLKRGQISYQVNDSTRVVLAHSLQGGLFRQRSDSLFISLSGAFYQSERDNITLVGHGSDDHLFFDRLHVNLEKYPLANGLPFPAPHMVEPRSGHIVAEIDVIFDETQGRYQTSASGEIVDAGGSLWNRRLEFQRMNGRFRFEQDVLFLETAEQWIADSPLLLSGAIRTAPQPVFDLAFNSPQLDLAKLAPIFTPQKAGGRCALRGRISGGINNLKVEGEASASRLTFADFSFDHFNADFVYGDGRLSLQPLRARLLHHDLEYRGSVGTATSTTELQGVLRGFGLIRPQLSFWGADSTLQIGTAITAEVSGTLAQPSIAGACAFDLDSRFQERRSFDVRFAFAENKLQLSADPLPPQPEIHAELDWARSPATFRANVRRTQQLAALFTADPRVEALLQNVDANLILSGDLRQMQIRAALTRLVESASIPLCDLELHIAHAPKSIEATGEFSLHPMHSNLHGALRFSQTEAGWNLERFSLGPLAAALKADFAKKSLKGVVRCDQLDLSALFGAGTLLPDGLLTAQVEVAGTPKTPWVKGNVRIDDLLYRGLGPYQALVDFHYDSSRVHLERLLLNAGQSTLLMAQGDYRSNAALDFAVKGAGFNAESIYRAVGKDTLISGQSLVDLRIGGTVAEPVVEGLVAFKNGRLLDVPFDEMEFRLRPEPQKPFPRLNLESFRLLRREEYELTASGFYPLSPSDSLMLEIDGSGNFLKILSDVDHFFKNPRSLCAVKVRLRGTPTDPRIRDAQLRIDAGELSFGSVVAPLSEVKGELRFVPEQQYFKLAYLTGKMGGRAFNIYSESAPKLTCRRPLQDMTLLDSRLNFGVLVLETPDGGVPLNFVGLMEPGKYGLLALNGRETGEKFYFAQSPDGLTLRGQIDLSEADIMYPFYESSGKASPKVTAFLENLLWDLSVRPMKNTRFVRTFPGAIDEVYINLKLDEQYGGLDFTGRLADETFRINGQLRATKGFIEYLDMNFRVDQAGVDFDRSSLIPVVYGQARAAVTDSLGISSNIILTMQTVDNTMDKKSVDDIVRQEEGRARINRIRFKLSSDNPNIGSSEAQILASLGYSPSHLRGGALGAIGMGADNMLLRPLFRPFERELENALRLDYVRFSSPLTRNLLQFNLNNNLDLNKRLALLESTKIIVGKYLSNRLFLQYTGQIESGIGYRYKEKDLGFHHTIGLDYQINPQVLVELEYDYDSLMMYNRDDKRIVVRHWFPF